MSNAALPYRSLRSSIRPHPRRAPAFTLIEILIALTLLGLLTVLAWPTMQSRITSMELPESASRLQSLLYMTRSSAMMEHRRHRLRFEPGTQQPLVEYEPDPILSPGAFVEVPADWAREPVLQEDVQVHEIRVDRPIWLRALSENEDIETIRKEEERLREERLDGGQTEGIIADERFAGSGPNDEAEIDETRPMILFEPDGSADWATIILASVPPEETLDEEAPQLWIVLDGRTGLAKIQEAITEEQLSDPTFYVAREKLELPDQTSTDDLTLNISDPSAGNDGFEDGRGGFGPGSANALGSGLDEQTGQLPDPNGVGNVGNNPSDVASDGAPPADADSDANADGTQSDEDFLEQLRRELDESDLSQEEKDEILRSFQDGGN